MFTNSLAILNQIKLDLTNIIGTLPPGITINLDEPIDLVWEDLPSLSVYQIKEDFIEEESFSQDKKRLYLRIELRMKSGPSSLVCTPFVNVICNSIKLDRTLNGLASYVELQTIQWANDKVKEGYVCGASVDVVVDYLI